MATQEIGRVEEAERWEAPPAKSRLLTSLDTLKNFARKKPLGFTCGAIVLFFFVVGDAVPETLNKVTRTEISLPSIGTVKPDWGSPVPYLADEMVNNLNFVYAYDQQDLRARLEGSSGSHLLGTDAIGRDIFSRILYGARVAVIVAFGAVTIAMVIGSAIGIMSGFYMKWVDKVFYRLVDVFQALPGLIVLIVILAVFGSGLWQLVFVVGAVLGPAQSRIIRGQTLYIMASPFIEAARVVGASDSRIMLRYILPNVFHLIVLNATFLLGLVVLIEASLSFLGYGLQPPFPSWGQMLSLEGRQYMRVQPGLALYPGIAIGILVFSFNLFGDALRDVLDPRLRGSR